MPRMTDHTYTEKIGGDSINFCGLPSRAGNRYDKNHHVYYNEIIPLINEFHKASNKNKFMSQLRIINKTIIMYLA